LDDLTWTGGGSLVLENNATFENEGVFDIQTDADIDSSGGAPVTFNNDGMMHKSAGVEMTSVSTTFNNRGTVKVTSGQLQLRRGGMDTGDYSVESGTTLEFAGGNRTLSLTTSVSGTGTISFAGAIITNNGSFNPGDSPGILHVSGDYSQTALASLNIELGGLVVGDEFDQLAVTGTAQLHGALNLILHNNFVPSRGDSFQVLTYAAHSSRFDSVVTQRFDVDTAYTDTSLILTVLNNHPVADDDHATTDEDVAVPIQVVNNDSDLDGDALSVMGWTEPENGTVTQGSDTTLIYMPKENFGGTDAFLYSISDGHGGTDTAQVTVTVTPVNDPPSFTALPDSLMLDPGSSVTVSVWDYVEDVESADSLLTFEFFAHPDSLDFNFDGMSGNVTISVAANFFGLDTVRIRVTDPDGGMAEDSLLVVVQAPTSVGSASSSQIPQRFVLSQNYPNPFNPGTRISFGLPEAAHVKLEVYNLLGQRVETLLDERKPAGFHEVDFNARGLPGGVYFYRLRTDRFTRVKKMILVK
ncbi:MAG: T9SS C-terminal target domain-containing protein, partial [Calditrichaeota bacterium]